MSRCGESGIEKKACIPLGAAGDFGADFALWQICGACLCGTSCTQGISIQWEFMPLFPELIVSSSAALCCIFSLLCNWKTLSKSSDLCPGTISFSSSIPLSSSYHPPLHTPCPIIISVFLLRELFSLHLLTQSPALNSIYCSAFLHPSPWVSMPKLGKMPSPRGACKTVGLVFLFSFLLQCEALWCSEENFPRSVRWYQANWKFFALASGCPASLLSWDTLCILLMVTQTKVLGMQRPWSLS